ncbi:MAG: 50S ribosomal protein L24 [Chloroflexi bacterium]|nr:50S ribosomal protein L24 [Chloroflexota bacterium]MDA8189121.1 50S ribosomal protein L24 [Dehalococcoidales bacterium]
MSIRKEDTVLVIAGKDKGKRGKVRRVLPKESKVLIHGINIVKRHTKPRGMARQAGIIEQEAPIHISNVALVCTKCNQPTRVGYRVLGDGTKARVCKRCGEVIG